MIHRSLQADYLQVGNKKAHVDLVIVLVRI